MYGYIIIVHKYLYINMSYVTHNAELFKSHATISTQRQLFQYKSSMFKVNIVNRDVFISKSLNFHQRSI